MVCISRQCKHTSRMRSVHRNASGWHHYSPTPLFYSPYLAPHLSESYHHYYTRLLLTHMVFLLQEGVHVKHPNKNAPVKVSAKPVCCMLAGRMKPMCTRCHAATHLCIALASVMICGCRCGICHTCWQHFLADHARVLRLPDVGLAVMA